MKKLYLVLLVFAVSCISEPKKEDNIGSVNKETMYYVYASANVEFSLFNSKDNFFEGKCGTKIVTIPSSKINELEKVLKDYYSENRFLSNRDFVDGMEALSTDYKESYMIDPSSIKIEKFFNWDDAVESKKINCNCDKFLIRE